jgi:hypothetical protein
VRFRVVAAHPPDDREDAVVQDVDAGEGLDRDGSPVSHVAVRWLGPSSREPQWTPVLRPSNG